MPKNPTWAIEFKKNIQKFKRWNNGSPLYKNGQSDLKILMDTGKGNCVAMSKLFRSILDRYSVPYRHFIFGEYDTKRQTHQVTVVHEKATSVWLQSNETLKKFRSFSSLIRYAEKEMGWQNKGMTIVEFTLFEY